MKRKIKIPRFFWVLAAFSLLLGGGYGVWHTLETRKQAEAKKVPEKLIAKASRRTIETRLLLSGEVTPAFSVEIKPEISGKVEQIHVRTGETVLRGSPLITIDDTDLLTEKSGAETEIEGARIEMDKRKGNYERARSLYEEKLISKEVFANLEADLLIAENNLVKAEAKLRTVGDRLSKTRILAPADGTILSVNVNEGQVVVGAASVNAGTILMSFADLSRLLIKTHINQMDIGKIKEGDKLQIVMQDRSAAPLFARVEFVAPIATVHNNIKGFSVEAVIEEQDSRLRPGMSVSMQLPLGRSEQTVSVPISAVFQEDNGGSYVYVRQGGHTERRKVCVGLTNFSFAEIVKGIEEGDEVLLVPPKDAGDVDTAG